jgi:hypothetical protein
LAGRKSSILSGIVYFFHLDESTVPVGTALVASDFLDLHKVTDLLDHAPDRGLVRPQNGVMQSPQTERTNGSPLIRWPTDRAPNQCDPELAAG